MVQYSNAPGKLLKDVDEFSGNTLKKRVELQVIFEEALTKGKEKLLEELAFTSKYIQGLFRVLREGNNNPQVSNLESVQNDLSDNIKKIIEQLKRLLENADGNTRQHFERSFFQPTQQSFISLNDLLSDLEWTKKYLNQLKRATE